MDSSKQSPLSSFKSKKVLRSPAPSSSFMSKKVLRSPAPSDRKVSDPSLDPLCVKTPGKPMDQPRRSSNRNVALSIADVRKAAMKLRERGSDPPPSADPVSPSEEEVAEPKKPVAAIELPENYDLLEKFFISLDSSIRLLQLKRSATTFSKISPQIETLTDRRFTYNHLAQLKFIMPEAIVLEKVLEHDERTSCMKPVLRITLDAESIKSKAKSQSLSGNLQLRKVFRSRLFKFFKSHPEADEVPEEVLPAPFDRLNEGPSMKSVPPSFSQQNSGHRVEKPKQERLLVGSHLPPSFRRGFSQRNSNHQVEKLKQEQPCITSLHSLNSEITSSGGSSDKEIARGSSSKTCSSYAASLSSKASSTFPETPVKCINPVEDEDPCSDGMASVLKTPVAMVSTPTSATPMLQPTKRCYMSPDNDSCKTPNKLVRRPPPNRPLIFDTPKKSLVTNDAGDGNVLSSSTHADIFNILPQSLIQSIQEKERLSAMEKDPAISQAMRRRKMIAGLPKLFDRIYFFFQSIKRSIVTKEELVHRLITQLDVVARIDVEEQLRLLQELAPEWIHEKLGLSGDLLLRVNKISSAEAMRMRLSEAI